MTQSGIEPATCRFVAWSLNHYANARPIRIENEAIKYGKVCKLSGSHSEVTEDVSLLELDVVSLDENNDFILKVMESKKNSHSSHTVLF